MSESQPSRVFLFDNNDPEMQRAYQQARSTFRYFWREIAWDRHRIVPALEMSCVKAPFSDGVQTAPAQGNPEGEHMWLGEVDFDGRFVSGILLNTPNWLKSVKEGDSVRIPPDEISDWMYVIDGNVYGAYTVNLLRFRMATKEREAHDAAWGLNFGDPRTIRIVYERADAGIEEHTMSEVMAPSLKDQLAADPSLLHAKGHNGWTFLHQHASAGSTAVVKVLLEAGADINAVTDQGMTALQLARLLNWGNVVALLVSKGAT